MTQTQIHTKEAYSEVEGPEDQIRLRCQCGHVIKRRRDSFLPGTHVAICTVCGNQSSAVVLLTGETRAITAESYQSPAG